MNIYVPEMNLVMGAAVAVSILIAAWALSRLAAWAARNILADSQLEESERAAMRKAFRYVKVLYWAIVFAIVIGTLPAYTPKISLRSPVTTYEQKGGKIENRAPVLQTDEEREKEMRRLDEETKERTSIDARK